MRPPKIPPSLEGEWRRAHEERQSLRSIADWLNAEHKLDVSFKAVHRFVQKRSAERAEVSKAVVREELSKTLRSDLAHYDKDIERLEKLIARIEVKLAADDKGKDEKDKCLDPKTGWGEELRRYIAEKTKILALRAKFAGLDSPDEKAPTRDQIAMMSDEELEALALGKGHRS